MTQDRPLLGISLMLGFCILVPFADALAKIMGSRMPVMHILTIRFAIQAIMLLPVLMMSDKAQWRAPGVLRLTFLRTLLHIIGVGFMFTALIYLPLADAVAIAFVMPFIMLILGKVFLGEYVGKHRLWACLVGFLGTLLVVQPNFVNVGWLAMLPFGVAVTFAFFMLVTRKIAKQVAPLGLQAVSGLMASAILIPATLLAPSFGLNVAIVMPAQADIILLLGMGVLGTVTHLLMTWSLRYAPSATLAPMQYLEIPAATLVGWLIFADLPNGLAALGICVTVAAGLYVIWRERRLAHLVEQPG